MLFKLDFKRSLTALWAYLKKKGVNTDKIWENNKFELIFDEIYDG